MGHKPEHELRLEVVEAVAHLEAIGFNHGSTGNVSCRLGDRVLITPTGANAANLTPERLVVIDLEGRVEGAGIASSEWQMHTEILRARRTAQAVVHCHADACVALSCLREALPPFHYMIAGFGGNDVRCARYEPFGSRALALAAVEALEGRTACLLANHGMIALAASIAQAISQTIKLETLVRQYLTARQAGTPVLLSDSEMETVRERYQHYGIAPMAG
jgi:L-fuculose-phosphate aldolase